VLEDARAAAVDRWLLGGDYGTPSPWPLETLDRLRQLRDATWIRGNGERWLREPDERPEVKEAYERFTPDVPEDVVDWLYRLPERAELDGNLYVHGSPTSRASHPRPRKERSASWPVSTTAPSSSATAISSSVAPARGTRRW